MGAASTKIDDYCDNYQNFTHNGEKHPLPNKEAFWHACSEYKITFSYQHLLTVPEVKALFDQVTAAKKHIVRITGGRQNLTAHQMEVFVGRKNVDFPLQASHFAEIPGFVGWESSANLSTYWAPKE